MEYIAGRVGNKHFYIYFKSQPGHTVQTEKGEKKTPRIHPSMSIFPLYIHVLSLVINGISGGILC